MAVKDITKAIFKILYLRSDNSLEVNGQILSQLFQVGGNHEMWHKDALNAGEFKLIRSHVKSDVRTISERIFVFVHMIAYKDENVKFSIFRFIVWVIPIERPREDEKNETFPDSEGFISKEKLHTQIWLDCICTCALYCLPWWKLSSTSANSVAMTPKALCNGSNYFFFRCLLICVTHFMNSECKNLTFLLWKAVIGDESKRSPVLTQTFAWLLIYLTSPSLNVSLCQVSCFPPTSNNFYA